ncbi:solute-binding protein [Rhodococcus sp. HNM0563]|uniref:substrate-binding domain-containing protein n=1 Tax=unclassified Rhodococcus (in: high G+C Gram-positive bacteria) TaxID=192944 RepID=UPI00146D25D5|nr:substrate-binding domain-containing protein [Rhodococcus sp. F64268]MCK0093539.1 substrate-binding domain-containing protein [Rhodococcus sp. F64268]NLU64749.1 solute-binding protein [Rhodococcus sp. HNM0563]
MARHRGSGGTRGVSTGIIVSLVAVALLVLGIIGWLQLRNRIDEQATEAARTCVEGDVELRIAADPLIAPTLSDLADTWNADVAPVIRDYCVTAHVAATESTTAAATLADGTWNPELGPEPALWVPIDTRAADRAGSSASGQRRSLATSPLVLATPTALNNGLTTAGVDWRDLPSLQSVPGSLSALGLAPWESLRMALPTGTDSDATTSALEAVATTGTGPLTRDEAQSPDVVTAITELALGADALDIAAGPSTADALTALATNTAPDSPIHAVPAVEKQLHDAVTNGTAADLAGFRPAGATPIADFPAVIPSAPWIDETLSRAAGEFIDYVRNPDQAQDFLDAGFRNHDGDSPVRSDFSFAPVVEVLTPADPSAGDALLDIRLDPQPPVKTTVLVDTTTSMATTAENGNTRLDDTATAIENVLRRSPNSSIIGIHVFDDTSSSRVAVARDALTGEQRAALNSALDAVTPTETAPVYESILAAYADAVDNYDPSRPNSVLVILDSDDESLDGNETNTDVDSGTGTGDELLDGISELTDSASPVRVDIVVLGDDVTDPETLQDLTARTGGSYSTLATTANDDLTALLRKLTS